MLIVLSGCGTEPADESTTTIGETTSSEGANDAVNVDDVGDASESSMTSGSLLILTQESASELWELVDFNPDPSQLPYVGGLLTVEQAGSLSEEIVPIVDGSFTIKGFAGDYVVCLISGDGPYVLNGCAEAALADDVRWRLTRGEGGFEFRPADS